MKTKPCLTRADVQKILAAAEAEAAKNKWAVAVAVFDDGGHLMGLARLDGATPGNVDIALGKGRTAALTRRSTKGWEERVSGGRMGMLSLGLTVLQGGLPIMVLGECVGSVGVSGVQSHEDEQVAQAGIDALGS